MAQLRKNQSALILHNIALPCQQSPIHRIAARLRLPLFVLLASVLLQGVLFLTLSIAGTGKVALAVAYAAADAPVSITHDEEIVRFGIVITRSEGTVGTW